MAEKASIAMMVLGRDVVEKSITGHPAGGRRPDLGGNH